MRWSVPMMGARLAAGALTALALGCDTGGGPAPDAGAAVEMVLGTNPLGSTSADAFIERGGGAEAPIVFGPQGAWMLIIAARVSGVPDEVRTMDVDAALEDAETGVRYGRVTLIRRPLIPASDGQRHLLNLYLVVPSDGAWEERGAVVRLDAAAGELRASATAHVVLRRQR